MYTYICIVYTNAPYLERFFSDDQKTKMTISPLSATSFSPHVYILPGKRVDNLQASTNATMKRMTKMTMSTIEWQLSLCKHVDIGLHSDQFTFVYIDWL